MPTYLNRLRANDYSVEPIAHPMARAFIERHHYAKGMSKTHIYSHGLFDDLGQLLGVAVWLCPTPVVCRSVNPTDWMRVIALSRLAIHPVVPKNACSFLMARSIKLIKADGRFSSLVSYADTSQGHTGLIYRASGWTYMGMSKATPMWVDPMSGKMQARKATWTRTADQMRERGFVLKGMFKKHKFVRYLDRRLHRLYCEL